jgi:hypothetical protein
VGDASDDGPDGPTSVLLARRRDIVTHSSVRSRPSMEVRYSMLTRVTMIHTGAWSHAATHSGTGTVCVVSANAFAEIRRETHASHA